MFNGEKIAMTGGAGFLGRAFARRMVAEQWNCTLTVFSRDDAKHARMNRQFPQVRCIRGDVAGDETELTNALYGHDVVIHAAAAKYVDLAEMNAFETVRQNITGSANVIRAATRAGVALCVGISTDKACEPVNVYGLTKSVMERLFFEASRWEHSRTQFSLCRYGNVIGSTGSVFTRFAESAARGEPLQITNPDMTRFYLTADEAVDILLRATEPAAYGQCVIPTRLRSLSTLDLARAATGEFKPEYVVLGQRPGEKVHESLIGQAEIGRCSPFDGMALLAAPGIRGTQEAEPVTSDLAQRFDYEVMAQAIADAETI